MGALLEERKTDAVDGNTVPVESGLGRKRLTTNTLSSAAYFALLMTIGLWYTPYMLHRIPEQIYGMVPLATSLVSHMVVVMTMITGPVCRYVSAEYQRGDMEAANSTLNSFVFGGIQLVAALLLLLILFVVFLPVSVPAGHETMGRILFFSIGASFLITTMSSCFEVGYWVTHRFEIKNLMEIMVLLVRNATVVALFQFTKPDVWQIAVAALLAAGFQLMGTYRALRRLAPALCIDRSSRTEERTKLIYSVGRWLLVSHIGNQLLMSSDLFLINRYFGTADNTKYGIALLSVSILRSVFASLGLMIVPAMVTIEATQSKAELVAATARAVRMLGSLAAHTTGLIAGLALPILAIWIKKPWVSDVAPFMVITLLAVTFEIAVIPLMSLLIDAERIQSFALGALAAGVLSVGLMLALLNFTELRYSAIAIPFVLAVFLRHGLFNPILASRGLGASWHTFVRLVPPLVARFGLTFLVARLIGQWLTPASLFPLAVCALATASIVLPVGLVCLPSEDRRTILKFALPRLA